MGAATPGPNGGSPRAFSFDSAGVGAACKALDEHGGSEIVVRRPSADACFPRTLGSGNWLSTYFAYRTLALLNGLSFRFEAPCDRTEHSQLLAWLPSTVAGEERSLAPSARQSAQMQLCAAAASGEFHSVNDGVARFAMRWRDEIRAAALLWSQAYPWPRGTAGLDSTAIHVRCGDLLGARIDPRRAWYGLLPYHEYQPVWDNGGLRCTLNEA